MPTIYFKGTAGQVIRQISGLQSVLTGRSTARPDITRGFQLRIGMMALSLVHQNLVDKARGGGGADGQPWAPLAQSTLERRRRKAKLPTRRQAEAKIRDLERKRLEDFNRARTDEQRDRLQRRIDKAKRVREQIDQPVEILRDTGVLFNSFSPGISGNPNQILNPGIGEIIVGTKVEYAKYHHSKKPRRLKADGTPVLPRRPLWPDQLPPAWRKAIGNAARTGVIRAAMLTLTGRWAA